MHVVENDPLYTKRMVTAITIILRRQYCTTEQKQQQQQQCAWGLLKTLPWGSRRRQAVRRVVNHPLWSTNFPGELHRRREPTYISGAVIAHRNLFDICKDNSFYYTRFPVLSELGSLRVVPGAAAGRLCCVYPSRKIIMLRIVSSTVDCLFHTIKNSSNVCLLDESQLGGGTCVP